MNILICEDDADILDLLEIIITSMGGNSIQSCDKESLFNKLKEETADLIILDYWLKKKRADNILVKLHEEYKQIPIILMSAVSDLQDIAEKFKVEDYIKKPFNIEDLKEKITKNLKI
ncbi:MAG: response regulator [Candidatus Dojkabacteria bacterium]